MRYALLLASLLGIMLMAACSSQSTTFTETWTGQSSSNGSSRELTVTLKRTVGSDRLTGNYLVERSPGELAGTISGSNLNATLTVTQDCQFSLTGTMTADMITASFEPADCPGGESGTWQLERQQ